MCGERKEKNKIKRNFSLKKFWKSEISAKIGICRIYIVYPSNVFNQFLFYHFANWCTSQVCRMQIPFFAKRGSLLLPYRQPEWGGIFGEFPVYSARKQLKVPFFIRFDGMFSCSLIAPRGELLLYNFKCLFRCFANYTYKVNSRGFFRKKIDIILFGLEGVLFEYFLT